METNKTTPITCTLNPRYIHLSEKGHALLREWSLIFYGTTQSIDPNDPISTPRTNLDITTPNSSSTTTSLYQIYSAQYPRISPNNFVFSKLGSIEKLTSSKMSNNHVNMGSSVTAINETINQVISNKKFTTKQGLPSTFVQNSKNQKQNKNIKGRPQDGAKSNKNSNGNKSKLKDSNPSSTQIPKNKYYRISQQSKTSMPKTESTFENVKLKNIKAQQSAERLQSSHDTKSNRKVVGDLPSSSSKKLALPGVSEITTKLPVKATKQVKNQYSTKSPSPTTEKSLPSHVSTGPIQSNQRITKLFERYEKIQSIFPEFQPYQPVTKDRKENNTILEPTKTAKVDQFDSLPSSISTNPSGSFTKPSRENTRKLSSSFVPDQKILKKQQLLLAAAGVNGGTQRPLSGTISSATRKFSNGTADIISVELTFTNIFNLSFHLF